MVFRRGGPGGGGFLDQGVPIPPQPDLATGPGIPGPPPPGIPPPDIPLPPGSEFDPGTGAGLGDVPPDVPPGLPLDYTPTALGAPTFARPDQPSAGPFRSPNFLAGRVVGPSPGVPGPGNPLEGGLPLSDDLVKAAIMGLRRRRPQ